MNTLSSHIKGLRLEKAVELIERTILASKPSLREATITLELRKMIKVEGVKQEIDLYVTIDHGTGYKFIVIFECKNWKERIDQDKITVFARKMRDAGATSGYFIAKRYERGAKAEAARYKNLELLEVTDEYHELSQIPSIVEHFHFLHNQVTSSHLKLLGYTLNELQTGTPVITDESKFVVRGEVVTKYVFEQMMQKAVLDEVMNKQPTHTFSDGTYKYTETKVLPFENGELFIDGIEYAQVTATFVWEATIIRPKIVSHFNVKTRGRVLSLEPAHLPGGATVELSLIELEGTQLQ